MRKSDNISIPGFKAPPGWKIKHNKPKEKPDEVKLMSFRVSVRMIKEIEKFAEKLELEYLPIKGKGYISYAIRLLIQDSLNRYMGPKGDDELMNPYADEMSKILPVLKNIRLRSKLEEVAGDNQGEIDKIMKEYG